MTADRPARDIDVGAVGPDFLRCVDSLYRAAVEGSWSAACHEVVSVCSGCAVGLALADSAGRWEVLGVQGFSVSLLGRFEGRLAEVGGDGEAALGRLSCHGDTGTGDLEHGGAFELVLQVPGGSGAILWIVPVAGRLAPEVAQRFERLRPHLARALAIHCRLRRAEGQAGAASAVLDRVTFGAVLVDARARPLLANRAARRMAHEQDGFAITIQGVRGSTSSDSAALRKLIASAASSDGGPLAERGGALTLDRPSGRAPYEVLVLQLPRAAQGVDLAGAAAVVFISDPDRSVQTPEQFFCELYDFTPAEARLAVLLARGLGLGEAAEKLGISRNTAHTQLSRVFVKTGTNRQSDLVRRLLTAPVRLASEGSSGHFPVPPRE